MVELKDRIFKTRSFKGTPTYSFVNRTSTIAFCLIWGISSTFAFFYIRSKNFYFNTQDEYRQQQDVEWVAGFIERKKLEAKNQKKKEESEKWIAGT